jgi:hypothetical protein
MVLNSSIFGMQFTFISRVNFQKILALAGHLDQSLAGPSVMPGVQIKTIRYSQCTNVVKINLR